MIIRFTVAACETLKVFVWGSSRLKTYERAWGVGGTVVQCTIVVCHCIAARNSYQNDLNRKKAIVVAAV